MRVDVLNGVNLDQLGKRDPAFYGTQTLHDLETTVYEWARQLGLNVRCRQTNHEGEYVEFLHSALGNADALVLNPGAWTHYSWAIRDALEPYAGIVVEVHLSKIEEREAWRQHDVLDGLVDHKISGQGLEGYRAALAYLAERRT